MSGSNAALNFGKYPDIICCNKGGWHEKPLDGVECFQVNIENKKDHWYQGQGGHVPPEFSESGTFFYNDHTLDSYNVIFYYIEDMTDAAMTYVICIGHVLHGPTFKL